MKPWMWLVLFVLTVLGSVYLWKKPKAQVPPADTQVLNSDETLESVPPPPAPPPVKAEPTPTPQNRLPGPRSAQEPGPTSRMDMGTPSEPMESIVPPPIPSESPSWETSVPPPPPPVYPYPESEPAPEYFEGDQNPPPFEAPPPLEEGEGVIPPVIEGAP